MRRFKKISLAIAPLLLLAALILLSLFFLFQTQLFKYFSKISFVEDHFEGTAASVEISFPLPHAGVDTVSTGTRRVKISLPYSNVTRGCEYLYGAVVLRYPEEPAGVQAPSYFIRNPRLRIKFAYDPRNLRCESKDIELNPADLPESISIQFIDVNVDDKFISEIPREKGLVLHPKKEKIGVKTAIIEAIIPAITPFVAPIQTARNSSFSFSPAPGEIDVLRAPRESFRDFIIDEMKRRTELCHSTKQCAPIRIAVAGITDSEIIKAIDAASAAGIPVETITNWVPEGGRYVSLGATFSNTPENSPWLWLRGPPSRVKAEQRLPMHTKFVIFGDDLVVSTNGNFNFDYTYRSREFALLYRSKTAASIFKEIFALIRSSAFYPVSVNLNDSSIILLNADRPTGYSATPGRPFLEIETNEGVRSTAYGILFELIRRSSEPLSLYMSPITNYCTSYRKQFCLFSLLFGRAKDEKLKILLNSFYYAPGAQSAALGTDALDSARNSLFGPAATSRVTLLDLESLFPPGSKGLEIFAAPGQKWSNHHERLATLGNSMVIAGSANYAQPSTINTIEISTDPKIIKKVQEETATFDEPYFVTAEGAYRNPNYSAAGCEFAVERELRNSKIYTAKKSDGDLLRSTIIKENGLDLLTELNIVIPDFGTPEPTNEDLVRTPRFSRIPLSGEIRSLASYFCVVTADEGKRFIVFQHPTLE